MDSHAVRRKAGVAGSLAACDMVVVSVLALLQAAALCPKQAVDQAWLPPINVVDSALPPSPQLQCFISMWRTAWCLQRAPRPSPRVVQAESVPAAAVRGRGGQRRGTRAACPVAAVAVSVAHAAAATLRTLLRAHPAPAVKSSMQAAPEHQQPQAPWVSTKGSC